MRSIQAFKRFKRNLSIGVGLFFPGIGPTELLLILAIVLLIFGGKKIPELMRSMGEGVKEFKKASKELSEEESPKKNEEKKEDLKGAARALGISTEGKTDEELRKEISENVKG